MSRSTWIATSRGLAMAAHASKKITIKNPVNAIRITVYSYQLDSKSSWSLAKRNACLVARSDRLMESAQYFSCGCPIDGAYIRNQSLATHTHLVGASTSTGARVIFLPVEGSVVGWTS